MRRGGFSRRPDSDKLCVLRVLCGSMCNDLISSMLLVVQILKQFYRPLHASLFELRTTGRFQPSLNNKATADRQARKEREEKSAALGARKTTGLQSRRWFCVNRAISKCRTPGSRSPFVRIVSREVFPRRPDSVKTSRSWRPSRFNVFGFLVFRPLPCAVNRVPARKAI